MKMTMTRKRPAADAKQSTYDVGLIAAVALLVGIGLLMVGSASMVTAEQYHHNAFYFLYHQVILLSMGLVCLLVVLQIPLALFMRLSPLFLLATFLLLLLVLIPGIGHEVNGSRRWLSLGIVGIQASELAKLCFVMYLASYIERHKRTIEMTFTGFVKPMVFVMMACGLLLLEPDFGASVVIIVTTLSMLFLAGARLRYFLLTVASGGILLGIIAISSPYRLERLTTFLHPWANQFGSGYQLTQSLIAFGRGGLTGVGLGNSIQKLFYLPEAHTDFLFAVIAEEFGLVGILAVIALFILLMTRIFIIAKRAITEQLFFAGYTAFGCGIWLSFQALVSLGVNAGLFPTKGLTLPFMSYGGSSILVNCMVVGILLRIDYETKKHQRGFRS